MKKLWSFAGTLLVLISFVSANIGGDDYSHHDWMMGAMYGSYGPIGMFFGWLIGILIVLILGLLVLWLIKKIKE